MVDVDLEGRGQSWQSTRLTHAEEFRHINAPKPANAHPDCAALWGNGHTFYVANKSGTRVYRLPRIMSAEFAKPERVQ